jgi:transposase
MVDIVSDARGGYRRVEVLTGPGRRRRWSAAEKARAVAESHAPGAVVSAVARRWQIAPQQLFTWRREARAGLPPAGGDGAGRAMGFVPIVPDGAPGRETAAPAMASPLVEVALAGAVVRVAAGADGALLAAVLRAVRASAA